MNETLSNSRPGSMVIVQRVRVGHEKTYREWSRRINAECSSFPGFVGLEVFDPEPGDQDSFIIVLRFESESDLSAWHSSETCKSLLKEAEPMLEQAARRSASSVFGSWFTTPESPEREASRPWKDALAVLTVLYPIVMILSLYVTGPLLKGWSMATEMYIGNILSVGILTWVLMPLATRGLAFWLHPKRSSGPGVTFWGLALVLALQFLMVATFHAITSP